MEYYSSEIDNFLIKLEIDFPDKSIARIKEEEKYRRIFMLRDGYLAKLPNI